MRVGLVSNGSRAIITWDMIHTSVQCIELSWVSIADVDSVFASLTRGAFLQRYCNTDTLICGTHFPSPLPAYIVRYGEVFQYKSVAQKRS